MGMFTLPSGETLRWDAADLKLVYVDLFSHTSRAVVTAKICVRETSNLVNHCGPAATVTSGTSPGGVFMALSPPALNGVYPSSGVVMVTVSAGSTFTLISVHPYWWQ
jgi:hypothetical protein